MPRKRPEIDWERVRELRRRSYEARGSGLIFSAEEMKLMYAAMESDPEKYSQIGDEIKSSHWDWLPNNPFRKTST